MFGKVVEKIIDELLARLGTSPLGWPLLILFFLVGTTYIGVGQLRSDPAFLDTILDLRFRLALLAIVTVFASYLIVRFATPHWSFRLGLFATLLAGSTAMWWTYTRAGDSRFLIDVVLDGRVVLPSETLANFVADVQQPHIQVTLLSRSFDPQPESEVLEFELARAFTEKLLRSSSGTTHTTLVTPKRLTGIGWNNLFYVTTEKFSVISTYGVVADDTPASQLILQKYLASMIPLVALHGQATSEGKELLVDRDPATEHGCLLDFSVDKQFMLEKLRRGPVMCRQEADLIGAVFGSSVAHEYERILSNARTRTSR